MAERVDERLLVVVESFTEHGDDVGDGLSGSAPHGHCLERLPQPKRSSCHLILDHLNRNGGCDGVLLDGVRECGLSLEDVHERRCSGYTCCGRALLLHARVLGPDWYVSHRDWYIDWSITVPLQMIEFYLILSAVQPNLSLGIFWRLLIGTVV